MNSSVAVIGVIAGTLLLPCPRSAMAARATFDVYDLLPNTVDRDHASKILNKKARGDVHLVPIDPSLVSTLQWAAPDPGRTACDAQAEKLIEAINTIGRVSPPKSAAGLFGALLEQAEQQFLYVDFQGVIESVKNARAMLPCTDNIVQKAQLRSLFLHEAAAYLHLGDPRAGESFVQMLVVDPRVYLEPEHPPRVRKAFLEAADRFMALEPRSLDTKGLPGDTYLDGLPVQNINEIRPGKHLVQIKGPGGQIRTALIDIRPGAGPVKLASVVDVGLPDAHTILASLVAGLRSRNLDQPLVRGLETYLASTGSSHVAFALLHDGLTVEIFEAGVGIVAPGSDAYAAYFRAVPPWKGAEPAPIYQTLRPTDGLGLLSTLRFGVGGALSGPSAWGGLLELNVYKRIGDVWYPGLFGEMVYQALDAGPSYPQARIGAVLALKVPISHEIAFVPAIGYGFGKGPPVEATCALSTTGGGSEILSCLSSSQGGAETTDAFEVILASSSHGPVMRLELTWGNQTGTLAWSAGLGLLGSFEFVTLHDGSVASGATVWPYTVPTSSAGGVVVVDAVASFGVEF